MRKSFTDHHLLEILNGFDLAQEPPLDAFLSHYFRSHKALGSKDRRKICTKLYTLIRFRALIDYFLEKPITWEKRALKLPNLDLKKLAEDTSLPPHIRVSFPKVFFQLLSAEFGEEKTLAICQTLNEEAPFTIRANTLKISRDQLFDKLKTHDDVQKTSLSSLGIMFSKRINLFTLEEFKSGFFEVQDEGSQLVADMVEVKAGDAVLDFCAGSGGKTLAFAPKMQERGQIFLYDIRQGALRQAKKRLKRAFIQNAQIVPTYEKLKTQKPFDWILLDVPCSGSGTLRRNPDMKWKFTLADLEELAQKQQDIFEKAFSLLKKGGHLVYATCSLFQKENEEQVKFFLKKYPLTLKQIGQPLKLLPKSSGNDGFFACLFQKLD